MSMKALFEVPLTKIASLLPLSSLIKRSNQRLLLPFYHVVSNEMLPHIEHLYPIKTEQAFAKDLDFILRYFHPIGVKELMAVVNGEIELKRNSFFLSFDDGLKEVYEVIAPILIKKGIPAAFFINSAFVDNQDLFYRYKASLLIANFEKTPSLLQEKGVQVLFEQNGVNPATYKKNLLSINYQNRFFLDELGLAMQVDFADFLQTKQPYMSKTQLTELEAQGFYIGAHSIDHPHYHLLPLEEQLRQTHESMAYVQKYFQLTHKLFAFPFTDFGVPAAFFHSVFESNRLDLSFGTAGLKKDTFARNLQRVPMEKGRQSAKKIIHSEYLYYFLKALIGKNRIHRL